MLFTCAWGTHATMPSILYTDSSGSTETNTWSLSIDAGIQVDGNDYGTATITEI